MSNTIIMIPLSAMITKEFINGRHNVIGSTISSGRHIVWRTKDILLVKECAADAGAGFGFTIRGGTCGDPSKNRPLVITHIRPNSPAER